MRNATLLAVPAAIAAFLSESAAAQVAPPSTPSERARREYDPIGGRVGSFILHPLVEVRTEYDDNVFATSGDGLDDTILTARGALDVQSLWGRHRLTGSAYVEQTVHAQYEREDALEGGARVEGIYDVSRDLSLRASVAGAFLAEDRGNINSLGQARAPTRYSAFDATASLAYDLDPLQLTVDLQANRLDFQDAESLLNQPIEQDFRDSFYRRGAVSLAYDISPRVAALVRGQIDRLSYTNVDAALTSFDRDSTGYALEGGVRIELSSLLFGEARAGVLHRRTDDPAFNNLTGVSFGANLTWAATPLTTVRLTADRQVGEGGSASTSGNLRSVVGLEVEHELLRNLILEAEGHYTSFQTIGAVDAGATEYAAELGATYLVNRRLRLLARVTHFNRTGDEGFFRSFDQNRAMIGARLVF